MMKSIWKNTIIALLAFCPLVAPAQTLSKIGMGYAQTSVNTAVFRQSSVATRGDWQFAAYYDADGYVVLAKRQLSGAEEDGAWTVVRTQYKGNVSDAHNVISIGIDGDGFVHLSFDHHGHPLRYCKGKRPYGLEVGELQSMDGHDESNVTYPKFYNMPNGDLLFAYRSGSSGRGNLVMKRYVVAEKRWQSLQDVLIDGENKRNAYWQLCVDKSGAIHVSWVWRETPDVATNHDLCYARSDDGGVTWRRSDGSQYKLPITAESAETAFVIPQNSELINQTSMTADDEGNPFIATYWREQDSKVPQYRLVWLDTATKQWQTSKISDRKTAFSLSGVGTKMIPIARPRLAVKGKKDKTEVFCLFRDEERGSKVSIAHCKNLSKKKWKVSDLTDFSVDAWEPSYDIQMWNDRQRLDVFVQQTKQGDGEKVKESEPQPVYVMTLAQTCPPNSRQYEKLSRGVTAVKTAEGVFVSWRVLGTDTPDCTFNIYRDGKMINERPLSVSNFTDDKGTETSEYVVKTVAGNKEIETTAPVKPWANFCKTIKIVPPVEDNRINPESRNPFGDTVQGGQRPKMRAPDGMKTRFPDWQMPSKRRWQPATHKYSPSDCSVADVDGDGDYELILKWDAHNSHDNAHTGFTDPTYLDCYDLNSPEDSCKLLWRICLGKNIRSGAHYTQFLAYDFDGDGKAELACKTAPGTIDGQGKAVLLAGDDKDADYVGKEGRVTGMIVDGPEYLTVFKGDTGEEIATVPYIPGRKDIDDWGDDHFNRSERYLACVAYLDGEHPSMVFCRGYYTQSNIAAFDFDGKNIKLRWLYQSLKRGKDEAYGQGAHSVAVGDVDNDGCDEIIYGSATIDHNGKFMSSTGLGHGDALHLGDLLPDRPGLEVFMVHESKTANGCAEIHDPGTGEILWREDSQTGEDNGRGVAMDFFAGNKGYEWWSLGSNNIFTADKSSGKKLATLAKGSRRPTNFRVYWDGDLQDEPYDGNTIYKPVASEGDEATVDFKPLLKLNGSSCNGTKNTPNLLADILGDWREEIILYDRETCDKLYIYTTTTPTDYRVPTLMHDHIYRMSVAWQNVCYNQPPHLGYYLGNIKPNNEK